MSKAIELIAAERERQVAVEGWTEKHDDQHSDHSLVFAATSYAVEAVARQGNWANFPHHPVGKPPNNWPWAVEWWKPGDDPVRMLTKAGALIAAEIDRLLRLQTSQTEEATPKP